MCVRCVAWHQNSYVTHSVRGRARKRESGICIFIFVLLAFPFEFWIEFFSLFILLMLTNFYYFIQPTQSQQLFVVVVGVAVACPLLWGKNKRTRQAVPLLLSLSHSHTLCSRHAEHAVDMCFANVLQPLAFLPLLSFISNTFFMWNNNNKQAQQQ